MVSVCLLVKGRECLFLHIIFQRVVIPLGQRVCTGHWQIRSPTGQWYYYVHQTESNRHVEVGPIIGDHPITIVGIFNPIPVSTVERKISDNQITCSSGTIAGPLILFVRVRHMWSSHGGCSLVVPFHCNIIEVLDLLSMWLTFNCLGDLCPTRSSQLCHQITQFQFVQLNLISQHWVDRLCIIWKNTLMIMENKSYTYPSIGCWGVVSRRDEIRRKRSSSIINIPQLNYDDLFIAPSLSTPLETVQLSSGST